MAPGGGKCRLVAALLACVAAHGDAIYVLAGFDGRKNRNLNKIWESADGHTWEPFDAGPTFSLRYLPTLFSRADDIVVTGNAFPTQNDIWRLKVHWQAFAPVTAASLPRRLNPIEG